MAIIFRQVKGAPLTIAELDGNFEDLDGRIVVLEDIESTGGHRAIDFIEQPTGTNTIVVHYTDSTTDGPFPLGSLQLFFRGEWQISTLYSKYDVVTAGGATYMVLFTHTSDDTSFDPNDNDGEGHDYYGLLLANPSIALPTGGVADQVLTKVDATNFNTTWATRGVPPDGETGDILFKTSDDEGDYEWRDAGTLTASPVFEITTDSFDVGGLVYANSYFRCTHASGCQITIPLNETVAFLVGTELHFRQCTSGPVELVGETNTDDEVTLNAISGFEPATSLTGSVMTAKKVSTDAWDVFGLLAASASA